MEGHDLPVGTRVGECVIQRKIGSGDRASVYFAQHLVLFKPVAVKVLSRSRFGDEAGVQRFLREARVLACLEHPNLAQVLDVGEGAGFCYVVTQYVDGQGLDVLLDKGGKLTPKHALEMAKQVAAVLGVVHEAGVVHRDLKPANVFITRSGIVKVTDFGMGADKDGLDARSDIYSLGATFYHALTGEKFVEGGALRGVPPVLSEIVGRMTARRYESAAEVIEALETVGPLPDGTSSGDPETVMFLDDLGGETIFDLPRTAPSPAAQAREVPEAAEAIPVFPGSEEAALRPGSTLGEYVLVRPVSDEVRYVLWEADSKKFGRRVALRILNGSETHLAKRLHEEIGKFKSIAHANIVRVLEAGTEADDRQRVFNFLALDRVEGETLAKLIEAQTLSLEKQAGVAEQVAAALGHLHQLGMVHAKLCPTGVFVSEGGHAVIMPFDAEGYSDQSQVLAGNAAALATIMTDAAYMAPEQLGGQEGDVDVRTDIYRLGVMMYHAAAGRLPFSGKLPPDIFRQILAATPESPRRYNIRMDRYYEAIIQKAMAREPQQRYPTAAALAQDLKLYREGGRPMCCSPTTIRMAVRPAKRASSKYAIAAVVALAVVVVLLGMFVGLSSGREAKPPVSGRPEGELQERKARASLLREHKQWAQALQECERGLLLGSDEALEGIARECRVGLLQEDVIGKIASLREARRFRKGDAQEVASLLQALQALESLRETSDAAGRGPHAALLGKGYFHLGALARAESELERAVILGAADGEVVLLLARLSTERWLTALAITPLVDDPRELQEQAAEYNRRAQKYLTQEGSSGPPGAEQRVSDAHLALAMGDAARARDVCEAGLREFGQEPEAAEFLLVLGWTSSDAAERIRRISEALERQPGRMLGYVLRAGARLMQNDVEQGLADIEKALDMAPRMPLLVFLRGLARERKGALDEAVADYTQAVALMPGFVDPLNARAAVRAKQEDVSGARVDCEKAIRMKPKHAAGYAIRGQLRAGEGELVEAVTDFTTAIELDHESARLYVLRGNSWLELKKFESALGDYESALSLDPNAPGAWMGRGRVRQTQGNLKGAAADFQRALDVASERWDRLAEVRRLLEEAQR
ncbi:MAG: tetratricopeptide repeat protein [Planctomycetes bacterium]|nr:tetratricopeptide repeat protein [Planctomycetota bacterium]